MRSLSTLLAILLLSAAFVPLAAGTPVGPLPVCPGTDATTRTLCSGDSYGDGEAGRAIEHATQKVDQANTDTDRAKDNAIAALFALEGAMYADVFIYGGQLERAAFAALIGAYYDAFREGGALERDAWGDLMAGYYALFLAGGQAERAAWGTFMEAYGEGWGTGGSAWSGAWAAAGGDTTGAYQKAWTVVGSAGAGFGLLGASEPDDNANHLGDLWESAVCQKYGLPAQCNVVGDLLVFTHCFNAMDIDCDGLDWFQESCWGTDPLNRDTDGDGWVDGAEANYWTSVTTGNQECQSNLVVVTRSQAALRDDDNDGLTNILDPDSENDYLSDGDEFYGTHNVNFGRAATLPYVADTDADGLSDRAEICDRNDAHDYTCPTSGWGSNPNAADSDNDGASDQAEADYWGESRFTVNYDGDSLQNNLLDPDSDADSYPGTDSGYDGKELHATPAPDPGKWDTDGDLMPDGYELLRGLQPVVFDQELDADNDHLSNWLEYSHRRPSNYNEATQGAWTQGYRPDVADWDSDNLLDGDEYFGTLNPFKGSGFEGIPGATNPEAYDTDSDGLDDGQEVLVWGTDPNDPLGDKDHDGLPDVVEIAGWTATINGIARGVVSDPGAPDTDLDGLTDYQEHGRGYDPNNSDSDGDGLLDAADEASCMANQSDSDSDGLGDGEETNAYATSCSAADSDGDGLNDGAEVQGWQVEFDGASHPVTTDPLKADTDSDGLSDAQEFAVHSDPTNPDTDGDGLLDGAEGTAGGSLLSADADHDGLNDAEEVGLGTNPQVADSDGDQLTDWAEVSIFHTDPLAIDSDHDSIPDVIDPKPLVDSLPPYIISVKSDNYARGFIIVAVDQSGFDIADASQWVFLGDPDGNNGYQCSATWAESRDTIGGAVWEPSHVVVKSVLDPSTNVKTFDVAFQPPLAYCGGFLFNITDERGNAVTTHFQLTGDYKCLKESSFDFWLDNFAEPVATDMGKKIVLGKYSGVPSSGAQPGPVLKLFNVATQGGSVKEIAGRAAVAVTKDILSKAPRYTGMTLFVLETALYLGTADLVRCDDQRSFTRQEASDSLGSHTYRDNHLRPVTLLVPGVYETYAGAYSDSPPIVRGGGLQRATAESQISQDGIAFVLRGLDDHRGAHVVSYCANYQGTIYRVIAFDHYVMTAKAMQTCSDTW